MSEHVLLEFSIGPGRRAGDNGRVTYRAWRHANPAAAGGATKIIEAFGTRVEAARAFSSYIHEWTNPPALARPE